MSESFKILERLPARQRSALEHLLYFNVNQERMLPGIRKSIANYGVPEIVEHDGELGIRVGSLDGVQTLFAVAEHGYPLGVAVFVHLAPDRIAILHVVVLPRLRSTSDVNVQVFLELIHEIRCLAKRTQGINRIEVVYSKRQGIALNNAS